MKCKKNQSENPRVKETSNDDIMCGGKILIDRDGNISI